MDTLTVGSITQLTEQRATWYTPELFVVELGTQPDPRDARIAELERALQEIRGEIEQWQAAGIGASAHMMTIGQIVDAAMEQDAQL